MPGEASIVTVREPTSGGTTVLESWEPDLSSTPVTRTTSWSMEPRAERIASNRLGITAIAGRLGASLVARQVNPQVGFDAVGTDFLLESATSSTRLVQLRVFGDGSVRMNPILALVDGTQASQALLRRASAAPASPVLLASAMTGTSVGDDFIELPGLVLGVTGRCEGACTFGTLIDSPGLMGPTLRFGSVPVLANATGIEPPTGFVSVLNGGAPPFAVTAPTRLATDGQFVYLVGQKPGGVLHIERRSLANFGLSAVFTSNGPLTVIDTMRSPVNDTVLVLATVSAPGITVAGRPIPYTNTTATQGNVVLLRINTSGQPLTVSTWDLSGDQRAVGFAHSENPGIVAEQRVVIIGNQGSDAFIWSVLHPP